MTPATHVKTPTPQVNDSLPHSAPIPAGETHFSTTPPVQKPAASGWLLHNVFLPLIILAAGVLVVVMLGSTRPKSRIADDDSIVGRMRRLPAADVMRAMSLEELGKPLELRVDGVVVPYREVAIAAEVSGRIIKKSPLCETGSFVTKGTLLVEIEGTDYDQEVERLTRMREQDYEAVKEVDQEIINGKRLITLANDDIKLQEREVKRLESLPEGFASQAELDRSKKALLSATQSKVGFENQLSLLAARRSKLEAAERLATTQLRTAEINLERTKIYSPVDGVIVQENAELNSFIQRGSPIATLDDVSKAKVTVNLRMDQLHWVLDQDRDASKPSEVDLNDAINSGATVGNRTGSPNYSLPSTPAIIEYEIAGRTDEAFRWDGTLLRYDGIGLDPRSRTVPVIIIVDQPNKFDGGRLNRDTSTTPSPLVRGMFVQVRLLIQPKTPLVAIPSVTIQPGNRVWQFVPDDSVLESAAVLESAVKEVATKQEVAALAVDKEPFDAAAWKAGRVVVQKNIVPVDSLWFDDGEEPKSMGKSPTKLADGRRYWICEVQGGEMQGGDWLVSSPLGEFGDSLSVRVKASGMSPTLDRVSKSKK